MVKVVVVNMPEDFPAKIPGVDVVTAKSYLSDEKYVNMRGARVFNMCRSYRYQSDGYYVSLLALARGHKVLPDVTTIQDTKTQSIIKLKSEEFDELIQHALVNTHGRLFVLDIYFGQSWPEEFKRLSLELFYQFQVPLLRAFFVKRGKKWFLQDVDPISSKDITENQRHLITESATNFFRRKNPVVRKMQNNFRYEIAILVNNDEKAPPSDKNAIKNFIKAANNLEIAAWTITRDDYSRLGEYDGLFIRETTNVNHHTYRFARRAAVEGLVVLDDPESIMKCSNKVYLAELLHRHNIPVPKTMLVNKENLGELTSNFDFPIILKMPDSCFSQGVVKAKNVDELNQKAKKMLDKSDLIIAQAFMPTEFDWRIGIINGEPFFACKYFMAGGHWQITEWNDKGQGNNGDHLTVAIEKTPKFVVETALKAANLIGKGLYGVDVKELNGKAYIVEVNDNPNLDSEVEDQVLGEGLYRKVMEVFLQRMEEKKQKQ